MAKKTKLNPYRIALQLTIALLLGYLLFRPYIDKTYTADFEAYCPFGGLQAFSSFLANNSLACSMTTTQIFMGFALVAGIILMSKLFCSYVCPIGSFTEWLSRRGRKLKLNIDIKGWPDRLLRVVKYALLFITFYFTVTSSELFCKTFDPYYAIFSGFSSDVEISYAVMALLLAIPGSFFIRQFWCKYACPLGAASNIFSHSYIFIGIIGVYVLLTVVFKLSVSWIWLLGALTLAGVLLETFKVKIKGFSIFRITRNVDSCTNCKLCDKVCPMAIKVSTLDKVKDIDCHLCGDCVATCPENNTLKITRGSFSSSGQSQDKPAAGKKIGIQWIPAASVVILVIAGLAFADKVHIPTISLKWGNEQQMASAGIYEQAGLTSIKCFGSSQSFANHMKEVPGVMGVETYVGSHSVRVWYDKSVLTADDVKRSIFTPVKRLFAAPGNELESIAVCEVAIDNFFDPNDAGLLSTRFSQNKGILAMQTLFGEPVHTVVYYDPALIDASKISSLIEEKKVSWEVEGEEYVAKTAFEVASLKEEQPVTVREYLGRLYAPVSLTFNSYEDYTSDQLETMEFDFPAGADPDLTDMPWYLLSHLSNNRGVVKFETVPEDGGFKLQLQTVKGKVTREELTGMMNADSLTVHLSDGTMQVLKNPYSFK